MGARSKINVLHINLLLIAKNMYKTFYKNAHLGDYPRYYETSLLLKGTVLRELTQISTDRSFLTVISTIFPFLRKFWQQQIGKFCSFFLKNWLSATIYRILAHIHSRVTVPLRYMKGILTNQIGMTSPECLDFFIGSETGPVRILLLRHQAMS